MKNSNEVSMSVIKVEFVGDLENLPKEMSEEAAGMDVRAATEVVIEPGTVGLVPTGVRLQMIHPEHRLNIAVMNMPRSSLCKKSGLIQVNSIGLVDSDYQGDIGFQFLNLSGNTVTIPKGERIGQIIFNVLANPKEVEFIPVEEFSNSTIRGEGAFGSTGAK